MQRRFVYWLSLLLAAWPLGVTQAQVQAQIDEIDPDARFVVGRVKYGGGGDWYADPTSLPNLLKGLQERTDLHVQIREINVSLSDENLYRTPFLYLTGHGAVKLTDEEVRRLREYLEAGGFLWADDNYGMDSHFRAQLARVFPDRPLVELPFDHPIYHAFYEFDNGPPKIHEHDGKPPQGFGIFDRGRMVVFYTYESDIGDGLEDATVHNDPPEKREDALRMAINVVLYSMMY